MGVPSKQSKPLTDSLAPSLSRSWTRVSPMIGSGRRVQGKDPDEGKIFECEAFPDQPTWPHLQRTDLVISELVEVVDDE
jgi:hypothetical protein